MPALLPEKSNKESSSSIVYENSLKDTETPVLKKRLIASIILLIPLMYVSMGHMLWNWPLPPFLEGNHVAMGLYELLIAGFIMVINQKFFISGFKGLIHKSPNMDSLVALGSGASFAYSVIALFAMSDTVAVGAIRALRDLNRSVPEDVSVIGFDGVDIGRFTLPRLTTVEQPVEEIARRSVNLLLDMMEKDAAPRHILVEASFRRRESVAPCIRG